MHPVSHGPGGQGEHAAQLAAAQHPQGLAGQNYRGGDRRHSCITFWVCSARKARSFSRRSGRVLAKMLIAMRAALMAPALPIATVPTGIPAGIWTIDNRESMPFKAWLSIGTPST